MNKRIGLLLNDMILYERKNVNRIDHTMKVLSFAKAIAACENVDMPQRRFWKSPASSMTSESVNVSISIIVPTVHFKKSKDLPSPEK